MLMVGKLRSKFILPIQHYAVFMILDNLALPHLWRSLNLMEGGKGKGVKGKGQE
jgi:hypothetical protein